MKILYNSYKVYENDFMMKSILTLEFKVKFAFITTYPTDHEDQRSQRNHALEHYRSYQALSFFEKVRRCSRNMQLNSIS